MTGLRAVQMQPNPVFSANFPATRDAVREQMVQVQRLLGGTSLDPDRCDDMLIVLGEVLNNIVEHACRNLPEGSIDLSIQHLADALLVETGDNGVPLPPSLLSGAGEAPTWDGDACDLPEGGFGWFMIHSLVDNMMYERSLGRNRLSFSFAAG